MPECAEDLARPRALTGSTSTRTRVLRVPSSPSHRKRKATEIRTPRPSVPALPPLEADTIQEDDAAPCDTLAAIHLLKAQFPMPVALKCIPVALKSQLYSIVHCRTDVDRELDDLRCRNIVRVIKLPCGPDEYAVCLAQDYKHVAQQCQREAEASGAAPSVSAVFDWFANRVCPQCTTPTITRAELMQRLAAGAREKGVMVCEDHVSMLLQYGLLTREDSGGYMFTLPHIGKLVGSIMKGRQELVRLLGRRKLGEFLEKELMKKKLTQSSLDMRFHLRHLLGLGIVTRHDSTCGPKIRLMKHCR